MADNINANDSKIIIDEEVGSGGSYNLNGHNNAMKLSGAHCDKIVILGHNNVISGTEEFEMVNKLVVMGHNNIIHHLMIRNLEVLGHNNSFKHLQLLKQPTNSGISNKFKNVGLVEEEEIGNYETAEGNDSDSSSNSNDSSDDGYTNVYTQQHHFNFATNSRDMQDLMFNIQSQVGNLLSDINISHNFHAQFRDHSEEDSDGESDVESEGGSEYQYNNSEGYRDSQDSGDEYEEQKYYEEQDEEADITPEERANIINSISSFAYAPKDKDEDENCAVCLSKLEINQQVKALPCKHIFHPKCINSWMKQKLICPCCKAKVTIN